MAPSLDPSSGVEMLTCFVICFSTEGWGEGIVHCSIESGVEKEGRRLICVLGEG